MQSGAIVMTQSITWEEPRIPFESTGVESAPKVVQVDEEEAEEWISVGGKQDSQVPPPAVTDPPV